MGRIFEVRKATMFARWDRMAKQFTRIGKEIAIAVKAGGPDPATNPALRRCIQNAKAVNMPKDRVEAAIKRAMGKEMENYEEILYEGYGPHGVAILVETATDNHVRTVANVKAAFNKGIHVSPGRNTIINKQVAIPKIGTTGTKGVLKALGASGIFFRITKTPMQTKMKANSVPMLVISPTTLAGTKAANKLTKTRNSKLLFAGVLNLG